MLPPHGVWVSEARPNCDRSEWATTRVDWFRLGDRGDECYLPRRQTNMCRRSGTLAEATYLCRRGDQNAADEFKISRRRVHRFHRRRSNATDGM